MDALEFRKNLIKKAKERNEFGKLEDGYVYYFPSKVGALQSHELRIIADELDERNKTWDKEVTEMLDKCDELFTSEAEPLFLESDKPQSKLILIMMCIVFWLSLGIVAILFLSK